MKLLEMISFLSNVINGEERNDGGMEFGEIFDYWKIIVLPFQIIFEIFKRWKFLENYIVR